MEHLHERTHSRARIVETIDPQRPIRLTPAQAGGTIHTRSFSGRFRSLRQGGAGLLIVLFFACAWLNWNGQQAPCSGTWAAARSICSALTLWPQDFVLISASLIIAAFGLFFITVLAGRVWCGYTCPQSVWTWMFMWVEKTIEGDRNQRIKLDAAPWSVGKLLRRSAKHGLWLLLSGATALTFVGYLTPIRELSSALLSLELEYATTAFWVVFFSVLTYLNAGWMREQVCLHMCPYARFQSVMFDRTPSTWPMTAAAAKAVGRARKTATTGPKAWATASTAPCACRSAPPASTSATACRPTASPVPPASTPATA